MSEDELDAILMERKAAEDADCLTRICNYVQDKIVPTDPVFYIVHCRTVDLAIEYYIEILKRDIESLTKENKALKKLVDE